MRQLPSPRGSVSELLLQALSDRPGELPPVNPVPVPDPLADEDLNLSLYLCYELHYRGLPGVDDRWEWNPSLLRLRSLLEEQFEEALKDAVPLRNEAVASDQIDLALRDIAGQGGGSLSASVLRRARDEAGKEF